MTVDFSASSLETLAGFHQHACEALQVTTTAQLDFLAVLDGSELPLHDSSDLGALRCGIGATFAGWTERGRNVRAL